MYSVPKNIWGEVLTDGDLEMLNMSFAYGVVRMGIVNVGDSFLSSIHSKYALNTKPLSIVIEHSCSASLCGLGCRVSSIIHHQYSSRRG